MTMSIDDHFDVLICGGGSAGLAAAIWLARFGIKFKILERRGGPLEIGQADGVQCRTVEIFESLGISEPLLKESYHVMEVAFWSSDGQGGLHRTHVVPDTEPGLSHQPHVILNQARINEIMTDEIRRLKQDADSGIEYGYQVRGVEVTDNDSYPVKVAAEKDGVTRHYKAKYVIGSDGAHSAVRKSLGFNMVGDSTDAIWGVMDVFLRTDFPDIRKKCLISTNSGNILLIPREGDEMVRLYIELPGMSASDVTESYLHNRARQILSSYELEIAHTAWWSAYSIGQRTANEFTKSYRVFLTGDACHTHSPKAGQGMNVSLQDGYNLGWKLGYLLSGRASPDILKTYVFERQKTAEDLIDFDRYFTKLLNTTYRQKNNITAEDLSDQFVKAGRYTAGLATKYGPSMLTRIGGDEASLASKLTVGMRFPSAPVVRFSDARPMQLSRVLRGDGRWHLLAFAGDILSSDTSTTFHRFASALEAIIRRYTPRGGPSDSVIDSTLVLSSKRSSVEARDVPELFKPRVGRFGTNRLSKIFVDGESYYNTDCGQAYSSYGIDTSRGAVVIVRPDGCKPFQSRYPS
ncbi:hypothetical protein ACJZ2D_015823 [Fusarium nematophilum]